MAAEAAKAQGKFWEMHDLLFANQRSLARADLDGYAARIGLDLERFRAFVDREAAADLIDDDTRAVLALGARGTPAFFINGRLISGAQPQRNFERLIDDELAKARAMVANGTPRSRLYDAIVKDGATQPKHLAVGPGVRKRVEVRAGDPWKGAQDAKVVIVEWSDFQCPFCRRVNPTLATILETYGDDVRIVFKQNPLPFHKDARLAAAAALAAHEQGKFWEMHDKLFANQQALKRPDLERYAEEIGLDLPRFKAALDTGGLERRIDDDQAQAAELGIKGTPHFFINGRPLRGAQPLERFKAILDEELAPLKLR